MSNRPPQRLCSNRILYALQRFTKLVFFVNIEHPNMLSDSWVGFDIVKGVHETPGHRWICLGVIFCSWEEKTSLTFFTLHVTFICNRELSSFFPFTPLIRFGCPRQLFPFLNAKVLQTGPKLDFLVNTWLQYWNDFVQDLDSWATVMSNIPK